jgi:hypothetical protein
MDYDSLREQHSDLGTAAVIVMVGGGGEAGYPLKQARLQCHLGHVHM